jgi:hypothetical protein
MQSFQIGVAQHSIDAARFLASVRIALQQQLAEQKECGGMTQAEIARHLGINRSVINRELRGERDLSLLRVGEIASLLGKEPVLEFRDVAYGVGQNISVTDNIASVSTSVSTGTASSGAVWGTDGINVTARVAA